MARERRSYRDIATAQHELPTTTADGPSGEDGCPHAAGGRLAAARPRIISASKRTDIPAFYLKWMLGRVEAGWVDVPNPMFRRARDPLKRLTHVSLRPEHVIAIVWWSKNYAVYQRFSQSFVRYERQFFHFTINPRRPDLAWIEPDVPPVDEALRQLQFLAGLPGGPEMVTWRYDPLCFWTEEGHDRSTWDPTFFEQMCRDVAGMGVQRCVTSIADRYGKFEQRIQRAFSGVVLRDPSSEEVSGIALQMAAIATSYGLTVSGCTEEALSSSPGLCAAACIDGSLLGGPRSPATDRKMKGRESCGCTLHTDIGDYVTQECGYSCVYCYANPNHRRFRKRVLEASFSPAGGTARNREH